MNGSTKHSAKKKPHYESVAFKFTNTDQVENLTRSMILFTIH